MRILATLATLLLAVPAVAASDTAPKPAAEKKICKADRADELSGTRLGGRKVCKTQADWDADREAQQRDLDKRSRGN